MGSVYQTRKRDSTIPLNFETRNIWTIARCCRSMYSTSWTYIYSNTLPVQAQHPQMKNQKGDKCLSLFSMCAFYKAFFHLKDFIFEFYQQPFCQSQHCNKHILINSDI